MEKKRALIRRLAERLVANEKQKEAERYHKMVHNKQENTEVDPDQLLTEMVAIAAPSLVSKDNILAIAKIIEGTDILLQDALVVFVEELAVTNNPQDGLDAVSLFEAVVLQQNFNRFAWRDRKEKSVRGLTRRGRRTTGDENTNKVKRGQRYSARRLRNKNISTWKKRQPGFPPRNLSVLSRDASRDESRMESGHSTLHIQGKFDPNAKN